MPCRQARRRLPVETARSETAASVERETLGAYPHQSPWLESVERLKNPGDQRHKRFEAVAVGYQNDDGDRERLKVLLKFNALVGGEDRVEFGGGLSEERTVAQAGPAHLRNRTNIVAYEQVSQWPGQRFIEQKSHATSTSPWKSPAPRPLVPA